MQNARHAYEIYAEKLWPCLPKKHQKDYLNLANNDISKARDLALARNLLEDSDKVTKRYLPLLSKCLLLMSGKLLYNN